jgi:acyl carrier protein
LNVVLRASRAYTPMDTLTRIKELAAQQFGGEPNAIDENAPVNTLGIDSLGFLEFLFELEDKFGFPIPQESVANVKTLGELAAAIDGLIAAGGNAPATPATPTS